MNVVRRTDDVVALPVSPETLHATLRRHRDYRPLKRVAPMRRSESRFHRTGELTIAVIDVETTGMDPEVDKVIELAVQKVVVDREGAIVETSDLRDWLEDPGFDIPPRITEITGIATQDVRGRAISDGEAYSMIAGSDLVLAHNAGFDRPFLEKRLDMSGQAWICSLNDLDWQAEGFGCRKLECLLPRSGWFYEPHRAGDDVAALVQLLDHRLPGGDTVVRRLIRRAAQPSFLIEAPDTPFAMNQQLKDRGYGWDAVRRLRWKQVSESDVEGEVFWLINEVYAGRREPEVQRMTWRERYAAR